MAIRSFGPAAPSAHARSGEVRIFGHFLEVIVRRPSGLGVVSTLPARSGARGLIDTGASDVCIDYRLAEEIGLQKIDEGQVGIVGDTAYASIYLGILELPEIGFSELMQLYALKLRRPTHDVLIGRSVLKNFYMTFDGPNGTFYFVHASDAFSPPDHDE